MICRHTNSLQVFSFLFSHLLFISDAFALPRSLFFFLCHCFGFSLSHTRRHYTNSFEWEEGYWEVCKCSTLGIPWLKIIFLLVFRKYLFISTHSLSHGLKYIHHHTNVTWTSRFWGSDIKLEKTPKSHANTLYDMICQYYFFSFFLGFRRPNLITGLSGWRTPD